MIAIEHRVRTDPAAPGGAAGVHERHHPDLLVPSSMKFADHGKDTNCATDDGIRVSRHGRSSNHLIQGLSIEPERAPMMRQVATLTPVGLSLQIDREAKEPPIGAGQPLRNQHAPSVIEAHEALFEQDVDIC
jgi:hypothetical protein